MQILKAPNYDFLKLRGYGLALSLAVIGSGLALMAARGGLPLGIDFSGGTIVIVKFQDAVSHDAVRDALNTVSNEKVVQAYGDPSAREVLIRLPQMSGVEEGASLEAGSTAVVAALGQSNLGSFDVLSTEIVGPVIGAELQRRGVYATLASLGGILAYVAFRFRLSFAVGAVVAVFHDILVTLAFLAFFGYELSLNVVAALLTITGYSVNDTIVIFDRVRENLRSMRRDALPEVINASINQTLARTIITSTTTGMAVLALFLFGGEVLRGFAFTMLVGIISGTYSTVIIASSIVVLLTQRRVASGRNAAGSTASQARNQKQAKKAKARARAS
jgi:preprotein translocase subunit SecF